MLLNLFLSIAISCSINYVNYDGTYLTPLNNNVNASTRETYNNFVESYFDNLNTNFPHNVYGSCGYVAISMLLCFYDTYLDDSIIPEIYDIPSNGGAYNMIVRRNSPGVRLEYESIDYNPESPYYISPQEYYDDLILNSDFYLQGKLFEIGTTLGFINPNNVTSTSFGLTNAQEAQILQYYLENVANLNEDDFSINSIYHGNQFEYEVVNFSIPKIESGEPVIFSIFAPPSVEDGLSMSHSVIGYEYDSENNDFYLNAGWGNGYTSVKKEDIGYEFYRGAIYVDFYINHSHSNNYKVNFNPYCWDDSEIDLLNHQHVYNHHYYFTDQITSFDSSLYHFACCKCNDVIEQRHYFTQMRSINSVNPNYLPQYVCTKCGYISLFPPLNLEMEA